MPGRRHRGHSARSSTRVVVATGVAALTVVAALGIGTAAVAQDRTGTVTPDEPFAWDGPEAVGHNEGYNGSTGQPCGKEVENYCDETLINADAGDFYETAGGGVEFSIGDYGDPQGDDFDLYIYESDETGALGSLVGASTAPAGAEESVALTDAEGFYLVRVIYWDVDPASGYSGGAEFFRRAKEPADVDDPPGLQDVLASDPGLGFKSQSEPHIAQSPRNPNVLVAASKRYNLDRDSLPEYEFKIGTYVSFDRGETWSDLGQLDVCPPGEAPPETWPDNDCYPDEDPDVGGTGDEDADDDRGNGDFGEEYITSDPWVDFDRKGNAYIMVLDSPFFQPHGNGWGMSFHWWKKPSPNDVRKGRTWSGRISINKYDTPAEQERFLDDKNTFAVNNAGRARRSGIMVACWGLNDTIGPDRPPQQVVCERSTDGGRSWPDEPTPVSPDEQLLVIAPHVVADTNDPETFYVVWLEYLSGLIDGTGTNTYYFSKSTDGGQTWSEATPVQTILPLPQIFPRQAFRNLSVPIMAVGPDSELYLTYADYNPAPMPGDEDGMQADVKLTTSLDGGESWSAPVKVNQDETNADQFQQYMRVTPSGQLNVSFFDRRLDEPDPPDHPGNFFIDTWLARSSDGGATWSETRVSHDSWDPSINPPISGSGEFIGDYQGLVADECAAIPFVNDTHLANDPARDPDFDDGLPRSEFQEVFNWHVPNTAEFGGGDRDCGRRGPGGPGRGHGPPHGVPGGPAAQAAAERAERSAEVLESVSRSRARELAAGNAIVTEGLGKVARTGR